MSVNLHLGIVIRDYHPDRVTAITQAVQQVLIKEEIASDLPPLKETTDTAGPSLVTHSNPDYPVIITNAYAWAQQVEKELREAVESANAGPCQLRFIWDDADEGREEEEEEEEEEEM